MISIVTHISVGQLHAVVPVKHVWNGVVTNTQILAQSQLPADIYRHSEHADIREHIEYSLSLGYILDLLLLLLSLIHFIYNTLSRSEKIL